MGDQEPPPAYSEEPGYNLNQHQQQPQQLQQYQNQQYQQPQQYQNQQYQQPQQHQNQQYQNQQGMVHGEWYCKAVVAIVFGSLGVCSGCVICGITAIVLGAIPCCGGSGNGGSPHERKNYS